MVAIQVVVMVVGRILDNSPGYERHGLVNQWISLFCQSSITHALSTVSASFKLFHTHAYQFGSCRPKRSHHHRL